MSPQDLHAYAVAEADDQDRLNRFNRRLARAFNLAPDLEHFFC